MHADPLTLTELERWELFGATWRAQTRDGRLVVDLCTCTGELVESRDVTDPELRARVLATAADAGNES